MASVTIGDKLFLRPLAASPAISRSATISS